MIVAHLVAAPHSFLPVEATQPDGSRINIYASGDEFHNWLHDENNYTIVKDESGAYVYAMQERGSLVPSDLLVGRDSPSMRNITPGLNLSREEIKAKYDRYADMRDYSNARAPHSGQLNNIVIFVKFSDSPNFSTPFSTYQQIFNSTTDNSMKRYFQAASYNQLTINSHFYPAPSGNTVVCYTDTYPRSFFQPYDASNNPNGYSGHDQRTEREQQMLKRAVEGVRSGIPTSLNIDGDNDGYVDNVCFIIQGATDGWSDLLWPHKWALYTVDARINGKRVWEFNFQLENSLDYSGASVLSHEMFHSLGAPDLYRYYDRTITPIGSWDLMAANLNPPQHMGAWMKHRYGQWISNVPTITTSGTYTLSPVASSSTNNIYRINSWKADEYYVLEYRKSDGTYDGNLPGTGLLVYRLDTDEEGNAQGPPDELYIYRPGGTNSVDGNLNQAHFSAQTGRTELSEATTPNGFLGDGSAGGLNLFDVGSAGNTITFKVKISDIQLTYPHGGEVWQSGDNRVITWKSKAYTGSVKLEYSSNGGQSWTQIATNVSNSGSYTWYGVPSMNNSTNVHIRISLLGTSHSDSNYYPFTVSGTSWNPPRNLSAIPRNGYVTLNWQAPISGTPTSYRIYRNGSLLNTVTALTYTDNAVVNETTYSYYVTAVYSDGVSEPSNTVQATPTANVPTSVILGSGTDSNGNSTACPVNVYYKSLHGQSVYTKAELNAAGVFGPINITGLGFNITGLPTQAMPNYVVRMGHTNATNVSDWIATGLTQVWRRSSFQPTATGWNMYTLSTPFYWDGNQNIVVDTAFSQIGSYSSSGTTQYTAVTNGYRFTRLDSADQTDVFSGGYISEQRPNLRLITQAIPSGPMIMVNPTSLEYGDVAVGNTEVQTFTIQNVGNQTLTGTITTPAGYTVAESGRFAKVHTTGKESRNSLAFSINAGASKTYNLSFAPSEAIAYNGNVVIANNSSNDPNVNIAVSGMGYIPPIISIDNNALSANLRVDTQGTDSFTITNSGSKPLTFNIGMERQNSKAHGKTQAVTDQGKSIAGSTLTSDATDYLPGTTVDWTFTVYNGSTDNEWLTDVIITFPAGVTVNSFTDFVGGSGGPLTPDVSSGNGVTITWHGVNSYGNGYIHMNESATATVNVSIASSFSGSLTLPWTINGDNYLAEPHTLSGSIVLLENIPWLSVAPLSGTLAAGASTTITANFSAVGMAVGTYQALITIHSNDAVNPNLNLSATMDVWAPDIIAGTSYPASNVTGATFVSNHDLFIVPGVDENTPAMADLPNLDPATSHIAGYTGGDNNVTLTFTISTAGDWYLMGYWGGSWHQATPFPLTVSSGSGTVTLSGIDFTGAKGDVYVVLSPDNNPTLPVELSHFSATLTAENYVQLTWTSQTESNLLGYNVYRNDASDLSSALKVSELIEGTNTSIAQTYIYVDEELQQDGTYYYWLQNVDLDGKVGFHGPASVVYSTGGGPGAPPIPLVTRLENAYPNPFNPDTTIRYQLKDPAQVRIDIYNLKGQIVRSFSQSHDAPGYYKLNWDGCDGSGRALSSGVYLYKMSAGSYQAAKKLVLKK